MDKKTDISSDEQPKKRSRFSLRGGFKFPRNWKQVKALGWKFIVGFILFYLIRDTLLYIVLPYLVYKGVIKF
jgi:hypothetical protein